MTQEGTQRKLAAILSADVKEYSRLMSQDERGTIRTLTTYKEAMSSLIQEYKGRVVDSPGDNLLAEFGSVVDAVNCAVEIQRELAERNTELPASRKMDFRIGINLGDIVEEEKRIYGDGVNIAARLEGLAEGGGICIAGNVHEQVKNKIGLEYEYLGEQAVKNIPEPVHAYRVLSFPGAAAHRVTKAKSAVGKTYRNTLIAIAAILIIAAGAWAVWYFHFRPPPVEVVTEAEIALPLPDKPSIAVLPFVNVSGDPKEDYLCDGITEQIITALSRTPKLFVIASNSTFTYKGKPVKIQQVRKDLGVRYVLEGSVQKSGDRVRITAQLIDAITGNHLWADKYDRRLKDIFSLQDDISRNVVMALQVKLTEGEYARIYGSGTDSLEAYLKTMRGLHHALRFKKNDNEIARKYYKEAIALDPEYPNAYTLLAWTYRHEALWGWTKTPEKSRKKAIELAKHAISLDDTNAMPHMVFASVYVESGQFEKALSAGEKGFSLDPDNADVNWLYGSTLLWSGLFQEAVEKIKKALQLSPINRYFNFGLANAYFALGEYEKAIEAAKKQIKTGRFVVHNYLRIAASYFLLGNEEKAQEAIEQILKINPKFSLESYAKYWQSNRVFHPKNRKAQEIMFDAVRKAGLK